MLRTSGGSVEDIYSPSTTKIASLVDPTVDDAAGGVEDVEALASTLRSNKLSRSYLPVDTDGAAVDAEHVRVREQRVDTVTDTLNDAGVSYASMKNLRTPRAMMSDIDLLVPDPSEEARAVRALAEDGYRFFRFRLLAHPLKTMSVKQGLEDVSAMDGEHDRPVDLYPDAIWIRKKVCDPYRVVERADSEGRREPSPADDLYLVATHAYAHLSVRFAELYHGVRAVGAGIDWEYLVGVAHSYGCADALYAFLLLLDQYLRATDRDPVPESVLDSLSDPLVCRFVSRWFERLDAPVEFPVEFPTWLATAASSMYHTPRIVEHATPREVVKDLQSHYLVAASKLLLGET